MSKKFRIAKRISMEDIGYFEDIEIDDDFVDNEMAQIIADNEYDPLYDDCESIAVALQIAGYGKVADLEAKLAESEKRIELADCIIKQYADKEKNLYLQLAEKDEQLEYFTERDEEQEKQLEKQADFHRKSVAELKQQLAEKQKETTEQMMAFEKRCQEYYKSKEFTIENLNHFKVLRGLILNMRMTSFEEYRDKIPMKYLAIVDAHMEKLADIVDDQVDYQIKQLKGEKK